MADCGRSSSVIMGLVLSPSIFMAIFPINVTIVFDIPTGSMTTDTDTGNQIPETRPLTVKASLKAKTGDFNKLGGVDPATLVLEGRSISPKLLPASIKYGMKGQCTIADLATNQKNVGVFIVQPSIESQYKAVTKALGSFITGHFIQAGG